MDTRNDEGGQVAASSQASTWPAAAPNAPAPPRGLAAGGRAAWKRLTKRYEFAPHELDLLREYCMTLDMIGLLRKELAGGPLTVHSPQAGPVVARPVAEIRAQQAELRRLAEAIGFPDPAAGLPVVRRPAGARDRR